MSETLTAEIRSEFGKGAARSLRRDGKTPAVVYGHGTAPVHVAVDSRDLLKILRKKVSSLEITIEGKTHIVTPRDIQIEPVRRFVEHVDLVIVTADEAASIAREAASSAAAADAAVNAAAEAAANKAAARTARQAEANAPAAPAADEAAAEEAPAEDSAE